MQTEDDKINLIQAVTDKMQTAVLRRLVTKFVLLIPCNDNLRIDMNTQFVLCHFV